MDKHWALRHKVGISLPLQPECGYTASRKSLGRNISEYYFGNVKNKMIKFICKEITQWN